ncbi:MAG: hypothetical protein OEV44_07700 [Spirochaetota bacterium]|nr:hypothetical protein [Spirochaetota bacterium]
MNKEIIQMIKKAIDQTKEWSNKGWSITFGPGEIEVASLKQAIDLQNTFLYKEEAVSYWNTVKIISEDIIRSGEKALIALEKGDTKFAKDMIYSAQYAERPYEKYTQTWKPIYNKFKN